MVGSKRLRNESAPLQLRDSSDSDQMIDEEDQQETEKIEAAAEGEPEKRFKEAEKDEVINPLEGVPLLENPFAQDADFDEFENANDFWTKPRKTLLTDSNKVNAVAIDESSDSYGNEDDESSDEDDAELLMREYEKLKREREEEKRLKELAKVEEIRRRQQEEVLQGNPLLNVQLSDATSAAAGVGGGY